MGPVGPSGMAEVADMPGMAGGSGMPGGSGEVWEGIARSGATGGCAFEAQDGVGGGAIIVRSPNASAGPAVEVSARGADSGTTGPTEYTSIGASQCEHFPSVPGVSLPHVGHCIAQTSPYSRFAHACDRSAEPGGPRFPRNTSRAPDKSSG